MSTPAKPLILGKRTIFIEWDRAAETINIKGAVEDPLEVMDILGRAMMLYSEKKMEERAQVQLAPPGTPA